MTGVCYPRVTPSTETRPLLRDEASTADSGSVATSSPRTPARLIVEYLPDARIPTTDVTTSHTPARARILLVSGGWPLEHQRRAASGAASRLPVSPLLNNTGQIDKPLELPGVAPTKRGGLDHHPGGVVWRESGQGGDSWRGRTRRATRAVDRSQRAEAAALLGGRSSRLSLEPSRRHALPLAVAAPDANPRGAQSAIPPSIVRLAPVM